MVRARLPIERVRRGQPACGTRLRGRAAPRLAPLFVALLAFGCATVPREHMDECQRISQTLRSENARLKDRLLALEGQNRDYADRAVDDARRLAVQDEAIERLEHSVQAYQDERAHLEAAYQQLTSNLGATGSRVDERLGHAGSNFPQQAKSGSSPAASRAASSGGASDVQALP
jgi:hypothetical protein